MTCISEKRGNLEEGFEINSQDFALIDSRLLFDLNVRSTSRLDITYAPSFVTLQLDLNPNISLEAIRSLTYVALSFSYLATDVKDLLDSDQANFVGRSRHLCRYVKGGDFWVL